MTIHQSVAKKAGFGVMDGLGRVIKYHQLYPQLSTSHACINAVSKEPSWITDTISSHKAVTNLKFRKMALKSFNIAGSSPLFPLLQSLFFKYYLYHNHTKNASPAVGVRSSSLYAQINIRFMPFFQIHLPF